MECSYTQAYLGYEDSFEAKKRWRVLVKRLTRQKLINKKLWQLIAPTLIDNFRAPLGASRRARAD